MYTGGPFYGYVVQVHVVVLCACVHLYVDMLISSQACEDNLDPQLDQCNEEVIRVALLTFDLKR